MPEAGALQTSAPARQSGTPTSVDSLAHRAVPPQLVRVAKRYSPRMDLQGSFARADRGASNSRQADSQMISTSDNSSIQVRCARPTGPSYQRRLHDAERQDLCQWTESAVACARPQRDPGKHPVRARDNSRVPARRVVRYGAGRGSGARVLPEPEPAADCTRCRVRAKLVARAGRVAEPNARGMSPSRDGRTRERGAAFAHQPTRPAPARVLRRRAALAGFLQGASAGRDG